MPESAVTPKSRALRVVLPLALLFALPVLAAYAIFFWFPQWIPEHKTQYGQLVTPARPALAFAEPLKGKWTYVQLAEATCEADCLKRLAQYRQLRLALNEKRERVQRALLVKDEVVAAELSRLLATEHPDLRVLAVPSASVFFGPAPSVHLLDPLGNWMMSYPAGAESRGIFKDIKKLLKISQIG